MSRGKRFTEQELEYIKVHAQDMTIQEIATALGRSYWAVQRVLQAKPAENLTDKQKRQIDEMKEDKTVFQIAKELGISFHAVNGYLNKRVNYMQNHVFTADEDFIIRQMYPRYRISLIATKIGVTEEQIYNRAKRLGLRKNRKSIQS